MRLGLGRGLDLFEVSKFGLEQLRTFSLSCLSTMKDSAHLLRYLSPLFHAHDTLMTTNLPFPYISHAITFPLHLILHTLTNEQKNALLDTSLPHFISTSSRLRKKNGQAMQCVPLFLIPLPGFLSPLSTELSLRFPVPRYHAFMFSAPSR